MRFLYAAALAMVALWLSIAPAGAQSVTGTLGFAQRHDDDRRQTIAGARPGIRRRDQGRCAYSRSLGGRRASCRRRTRPNVLLIITDDAGFGVPSTFGGVIPTPTMDRIANDRTALQQHPLDRAVLADAGRADHRPQPSFGRLRRDLRAVDRLPRLQQHHRPRTRPRSAGFCSTTATPRPGSARITTCRHSRPARRARSISGRPAWASNTSTGSSAAMPTSGSRTCSATPRRSIPSTASRAGTWSPAMADDAIDYLNRINQTMPDKPFFIKYAPGATHAPHHPTQEWVDKISEMHLFDDG